MDLSIIIVNYNAKDLTLACIDSLMKSNDQLRREIIVVDNASRDGSIDAIARSYAEIKVIKNEGNVGFGAANNTAAKVAKGEYLLFLNSDAKVYPDTLGDLWEQIHLHQAAIASCKLLNPDGSLQPQGGSLPHLLNVMDWMLFLDDLPGINRLMVPYQQRNPRFFQTNRQPGWIAGTAMLVKRSVFNRLGGFDENIFLYGEDVEFCYRAKKAGDKVYYFAKPQVLHLGQGSGSSGAALLGEYKGLIYLFKKHKPAWQLVFLQLFLKTGALLRIIIFGMIRGDAHKKTIYQQAFRL